MNEFKTLGGAWGKFITLGIACTVGLAACNNEVGQSTLLNPEGPPMIRQVFLNEKVTVTTDTGTVTRTLAQLAFGAHPEFTNENDQIGVKNAVARGSQRIRVVVDELLLGNNLEEIACADGSFSRVPIGADPDDIAKCAGPELSQCTGDFAVCIGANGPIGILDENEDGASDDLRLIDGVMTLTCDGTVIPYDRQQSFYQPSGNQQIPAGPLGVHGLGPAFVLVPTEDGIRTGANCSISFGADVVDKDGIRLCAPPDGDVNQPCPGDGDTSLVGFTVEALALTGNDPADGATNVSLTSGGGADRTVLLQFNAAIDNTTLTSISVTAGGVAVPGTAYTATVRDNDKTIIEMVFTGGFAPNTDYVVTIGATLADIYGGALPAEETLSFTTRDATPQPDAAPAPDADTTPDAGAGTDA